MSAFKFSCPFCGQHFEIEAKYTGRKVECPTCRNEITIPSPEEPSLPAAVSSEDPDEEEASAAVLLEDPEEEKTDRCPYCVEPVNRAAVVCPHCRRYIFRCPQCGSRGLMDYQESPTAGAKSLSGGVCGAIAGGLFFGTMGAVLGWIGGSAMSSQQPSAGILKCRICGHVIEPRH